MEENSILNQTLTYVRLFLEKILPITFLSIVSIYVVLQVILFCLTDFLGVHTIGFTKYLPLIFRGSAYQTNLEAMGTLASFVLCCYFLCKIFEKCQADELLEMPISLAYIINVCGILLLVMMFNTKVFTTLGTILGWVLILKICAVIMTLGNNRLDDGDSDYEREEQRQREQDERWSQIQEQRNQESAERERKKNNIVNAYNRGPYTVMVNFESGRTMALSGQLQGFTSSTVTVLHNKNIKTYNTKGNIIDSRSI